MGAARFLDGIARVASVTAALVIVLGVGARFIPPEHFQRGVLVDRRVEVPSDWTAYPIVAGLRADDAKTIASSDLFFTGEATRVGSLGDVFVRYEESYCTDGGSACACSLRTLTHVYVGDLDADDEPSLATEVDCTTTSICNGPVGSPRRCDPRSLVLRRSADGAISVVTFVDPEPTERPITAFARTVVPRARAPLGRRNLWICLLALALWAGGALALLRSRRYLGERGRLTWREGEVFGSVVTCADLSVIAPGFERRGRAVLVDPAALTSARSYRSVPSIDRAAIVPGTRAEALAAARLCALAAAIASMAGLVAAVLAVARVFLF
jgi:hypothetical protein